MTGGIIFSNETWINWEKSGKSEVVQKIKQLIKEDGFDATITKPNKLEDLSLALYELTLAVVKGHLRRDYAKPVFVEILNWHDDVSSQLVEVFSMVEVEIMSVDRLNKQRDNFLNLLKVIDLDKIYKERLEIDTLGDANIIKNKKNFLTKQVKVRTKMFYKQQKFNLLREESEGYAKLITELNQEITAHVTPSSVIHIISSLIGCFNLDPNRVLDVILESFESRPEEHKFYNGVLALFPHESATISEILGFKLSNLDKEAKSVYIVIAYLLKANILSLADIYDWLTPEDSSMIDDYNREMEAAKEFAQRANVVSTKDKENGGKEKEKEDEETVKIEHKNLQKFHTNQKIQLAIALLEVGNWDDFSELCGRFPDFYLVSCLPVSGALCKLIHQAIQPLYKSSFRLPERMKAKAIVEERVLKKPPLVVETVEDFSSIIFPMLSILGPYIYHDVSLIYKILRISREHLNKISKGHKGVQESFYYDFLSVLDWCILPSVSMFESNPCVAEEVWETIKLYPYQHRYKLYGRWKNETYMHFPALIRNRTQLLKKAKYIMMRITKETIKPVSRGIGKQTHNFPGPIFEYILKQVQLYDNLISPVVDSFKYLTSLSYDILGYCIVEVLSQCKDRTQNDAMAISPWLQSLSNFTGSVCKKYPLDLGGILQFVANQLKCERSIDVLLLKDIVQKMGGTDSMGDLTPDLLEAMCGGEHLRREAGQYLQEKNTKRSSMRLKDSLIEQDLAIPLLLLMAQQRSSIVYNQTESPHLKLVGKLYDQCQDTMVQFGSYFFQMVNIEELSNKLPPIENLLAKYHINADIAFFLGRPMFNYLLQNKYDELRRKDKSEKKLTLDDKKQIFIDACRDVFGPLVTAVRPHYSPKVWEDMDPEFFLIFWTLTMVDLEVPNRIYDKEIKKLTETLSGKSRKREIERINSLKDKLEDERKRQNEHSDRVLHWLAQEKDLWFKQRTIRSPKNDTVTTFLQHCIFPRCTFTTIDAIYCARFVQLLHSLKTPDFSTLLCYDRMYCDITYTVTSCTEQEAHHYARFLLGTLDTIMFWHRSKENFEKECSKYPGFITRYKISTHEANDYVDYENYRHVVHKWHYKITKALVTCLESGDYIQIRNAIFILQGILPQFPAIINLALVIEKRIEKVKSNEKNQRNDLFVLANSYSGRLKAKKPNLLSEGDFHLVRRMDHSQKNNENKSTKKESSENILNGEVDGKEDSKGKLLKKTDSHRLNSRMKEEEERKEDEREDKKRKEKKKDESKRKRDLKKIKIADDDLEDITASEDGDQRESSVASNGSSTSAKMEPPPGEREGGRSSKRRKTDHDSKSKKEDRDKKRRSESRESDTVNSFNKKEKKERKRASSPSAELSKTRSSRKSQRI